MQQYINLTIDRSMKMVKEDHVYAKITSRHVLVFE